MCKPYVGLDQNATLRTPAKYFDETPKLWESGRSWYVKSHSKKHPKIFYNKSAGQDYNTINSFEKAKTRALYHPHKSRGEMDAFEDRLSKQLKLDIYRILNSNEKRSNHTAIIDSLLGNKSEEFLDKKHHARYEAHKEKDKKNPEMYDLLTLIEDYLNSSGLKSISKNDVAYRLSFKKETPSEFSQNLKTEKHTDYPTQNVQNFQKHFHDLESDIKMLNVSSDKKLNEFVKKMADHISLKILNKNSSLKSHDIKTRSENSISISRSFPNQLYSISGRNPSRRTIWSFWYRILKHNKKRGSYQTLLHQQNKILKIIKDVFFAGYKEIGDFSYDKFYLIRFALLNKYPFSNISLMVPFSLKENYRKITIKILSKIYTLYDPSEILCISSAKEFVEDYKKREHFREEDEEFDSVLRTVLKGTKYDDFDTNLGKIIFVASESEAMKQYKRELMEKNSIVKLPSVPVLAGKAKSKHHEKTFDLKNYSNGIGSLKPSSKHKGGRDNRMNKPLFRQKLRLHFQKIFNPNSSITSTKPFYNLDNSIETSRTLLRSSMDESEDKLSHRNSYSKLSTALSNKSFSATSEWQNTGYNMKEPNSSLYLLEQLPDLPNLQTVRKPSLSEARSTSLEKLSEVSPSPSSSHFQKESSHGFAMKNLYFICFVPHSKKYIRKFFLPVSSEVNKSSMAKRIVNALYNIYNSSEDIYLAPVNEFLNTYKIKLTSNQKYNNLKTLENILDKPDHDMVFPEILFVSPLSEYKKRFNQFSEEAKQENKSLSLSPTDVENYEKLADGEIPLGSKIVSFLRNNHNDSLINPYMDPKFNAFSILQDIGRMSTFPSVVSAWKDYSKIQKSKLDSLKKILADQKNISRTTALPTEKMGSIHFDLEQMQDHRNFSEMILVALAKGNDTKRPFPIVIEKGRQSIPKRVLNESVDSSKLIFPMLTTNNLKKNLSKSFSGNLFLGQDPSIVETGVNNTKFVVVSRDKAMARIFNSILLKMFSKQEKKRRERAQQHYYYLVRPLSRESSNNISQKVPFSDHNFVKELFTYIYRIYSQTEVVYIVPAHDVIKENDPKNTLLKKLLNYPKTLPNLTNIIFIASAGEILDNYRVSSDFGEASLLLKSLPDLESLPSTPYVDNINFFPLKPGGIFYPSHNHSKLKDGEYKYLVKTLKRIKNVRHKGNKTQDVYIVVKKNCSDSENVEHRESEEPKELVKTISHPHVRTSKDVKLIAKELNNLFKNVIEPKPSPDNFTMKPLVRVNSKSRPDLTHGNSTVSIHFEPIFVYYGDNKIRSYEMEKLKLLLGKNADISSRQLNYTNYKDNSMLQKDLASVNSVLMEVKRDISAATNRSEHRIVDRKMSYTDINYGSGDSALEKSESEADHFDIEKPRSSQNEKTEEEMSKFTDFFKTTNPAYEEPTFEQGESQLENSDDPQYEASNSEKYNPADNRSKQIVEKFIENKNTQAGSIPNSITNDENYDDTHLGPFDGLSNGFPDQSLGDTIESGQSLVSHDLRSLDKDYDDGEEEDYGKDLHNFGSKKIKHAKAVLGFKTPLKLKFLTKSLDEENPEGKSESQIMLKSYSISSDQKNNTNKKSEKSNNCKYHERNGEVNYSQKRGRYVTNDIDAYDDCYSPAKGKRDTDTAKKKFKETISTTEKTGRKVSQFIKSNFLDARQNVTQSWFRKLLDYHR